MALPIYERPELLGGPKIGDGEILLRHAVPPPIGFLKRPTGGCARGIEDTLWRLCFGHYMLRPTDRPRGGAWGVMQLFGAAPYSRTLP